MTEINRSDNWNPEQDKINAIKNQLETFKYEVANISTSSNPKSLEENCAKLIVLLISIEKEVANIEQNLEKIWEIAYTNKNQAIQERVSISLKTLKNIKLKLTKARLTLNYTFI